jgi:hypothetical protein
MESKPQENTIRAPLFFAVSAWYNLATFSQAFDRLWITGICHDQWQVCSKAQFISHRLEFFSTAPGNRPRHVAVHTVLFFQVFGDQFARVAGGAVDDDSQFSVFTHNDFPL